MIDFRTLLSTAPIRAGESAPVAPALAGSSR